jgi:hypothetical protein
VIWSINKLIHLKRAVKWNDQCLFGVLIGEPQSSGTPLLYNNLSESIKNDGDLKCRIEENSEQTGCCWG